MNTDRKGESPFYPGQPVPAELFVGRSDEVVLAHKKHEEKTGEPLLTRNFFINLNP